MEEVFAENGEGTGDRPTRGFLEKTFQVILRVSPPLLSHWRRYLDKQIGKVFGKHVGAEEHYRVFRLLELDFARQKLPVTPRALKSLVNGLAAEFMQWGDKIPLEFQVLYILNRERIARDIDQLKQSTLLDDRTAAYMRGTEWAKYLAAAHFNVDPEQAVELLLSQDIKDTLASGDHDRLKALQATNGSEVAIHSVVEENAALWMAEEPETFARACAALRRLELKDNAIEREVWRHLATSADKFGALQSFGDDVATGIVAVIERSDRKVAVPYVRLVLSALMRAEKDASADARDPAGWLRLIDRMARTLAAVADEKEADRLFRKLWVPGDVDFLLGVAEACQSTESLRLSSFRSGIMPSEVSNKLVEAVQADPPAEWFEKVVLSLLEAPGMCQWPDVVNAIQIRLQANQPELRPGDMLILLNLLSEMRRQGNIAGAADAIASLVNDGTILGILGIARSQKGAEDLIAAAVWTLVVESRGQAVPAPQHPRYGPTEPQAQFYEELRRAPEQHSAIVDALALRASDEHWSDTLLASVLGKKPGPDLFGAIFRNMVQNQCIIRLTPARVLTGYEKLAQILGDTLEPKFLEQFDEWADHVPNSITGEATLRVSSRFIRRTAEIQSGSGHRTREVVSRYLSSLDQERWHAALASEDDALRLLIDLIETDSAPSLPEHFQRALWEHVEKVMEGKVYPKRFAQGWHRLPGVLHESVRNTFYKNLLSALLSRVVGPEELLNVFSLYDPEFMQTVNLRGRADDVVRTFVGPILGEADEDGLDWIEANADELAKCVEESSHEAQTYLRTTIGDVFRREDIDKERINALATRLGCEERAKVK